VGQYNGDGVGTGTMVVGTG